MSGKKIPRPPNGLRLSGRALWRAVVRDFELDEHEVVVLREACRTADSLDALQALLDEEGTMSRRRRGRGCTRRFRSCVSSASPWHA